MDVRRVPRIANDPKFRQVGFFAPGVQPNGQAGESLSPPLSDVFPSVNSLSPVMIPPPGNLYRGALRALPVSVLPGGNRGADSSIPVGSYNPSEFQSSAANTEFSEEQSLPRLGRRNSSGIFSTSLPAGNFDFELAKESNGVTLPAEKGEQGKTSAKPLKEKMAKAERRAIQEEQRAAKAAARGQEGKGSGAASVVNTVNANTGKVAKAHLQKKESSSPGVAQKRIGDRQPNKEKKKDLPQARMQFDDTNRVEKTKKRSVVKQTESKNRVELFRHLPHYGDGACLPDLESKFFQLHTVDPAIYKVGMRYLAGDISGGNARCIAMLLAFRESITNYSTPPEKSLSRDLTTKINGYVSFLKECKPLSISMGNAIRFLKTQVANSSLHLSESDAKEKIISDIDRFVMEKIILADEVIVNHAVTKIRDGDVILTYASSSVVEMILLHAHELGRNFQVVVVDSRPKLEGRNLLVRLLRMGISCTYTHINAVSYIMPEVTRVFLGASSVLSNGTVYSRVGTACIAMVAHNCHVPVMICCEAYKFHERVQLDSICCNELGDPDAISEVPGRNQVSCFDKWSSIENLQLLNLSYDLTPPDYVSMIITDFGNIPPSSVAVIVHEHRRENLWTPGHRT